MLGVMCLCNYTSQQSRKAQSFCAKETVEHLHLLNTQCCVWQRHRQDVLTAMTPDITHPSYTLLSMDTAQCQVEQATRGSTLMLSIQIIQTHAKQAQQAQLGVHCSNHQYFTLTYTDVLEWPRAMKVVEEEQAATAAAAAVKREAGKRRQVSKALEASRLRAERATRVAKLKVRTHSPPQVAMLDEIGSAMSAWKTLSEGEISDCRLVRTLEQPVVFAMCLLHP